MPFDGNPAKFAKPDVFSLEGLVAWLEKQPADTVYCYSDAGRCLAAEFNKACGRQYRVYVPLPVSSHVWLVQREWGVKTGSAPSPHRDFAGDLEVIAVVGNRTYGAALGRARALLAEQG